MYQNIKRNVDFPSCKTDISSVGNDIPVPSLSVSHILPLVNLYYCVKAEARITQGLRSLIDAIILFRGG